jgi:RNA polymerase primary sigma factor
VRRKRLERFANAGSAYAHLLYDEINELLPSDMTSSDELDELFETFGGAGIEVIDSD